MPVELLNTKLYVPPVCSNLMPRPCLFDRLLPTTTNRLVLVSAPAGYGKTTLISSWLQASHFAGAWLSLDEGDNDPVRFLQYLVRALAPVIPSLKIEMPGILQELPSDSLLNPILNAMASIQDGKGQPTSPFVLVLDDFHVIHTLAVLDMVTALVERMPSPMRLIILSRADPPLPLARWRARQQMVEVRSSHLRLTRHEIAHFLSTAMPSQLSEDDIGALEARTEGWVAGLQLAALAMQGRCDVHAFVGAFTGSHYYVMDYLLEEVLRREPERVRTFLLETSILDRLCGPLCEAIIGDTPERVDGQTMLQELEQRNLFLVPLDDERRWYRYHHLFADVLSRHLERVMPEQVRELHRRACRWHEQQGFIPEAIRHALLAQDQERAVGLVEQNGCLLLIAGEVVTLNQWLQAVTAYAPSHPWLAILRGWVLTLTGQHAQVEPVLQGAEGLLSTLDPALDSTTNVRIMRGALAAARAHSTSMQGDPVAAEFARQALACLPEGDALSDSLRSVATLILGSISWMRGNLEEAQQAYGEAVRIGRAANNPHLLILGNCDLADILIERGQLQLAVRKLSEALQMATRPDGLRSLMADRVLAGLSQVAYEWNDLEAAARYAYECVELCRRSGNLELEARGQVTLAQAEYAQGCLDKALEATRAAEQLTREPDSMPARSIWAQCALARLWLTQGNTERVAHFLQEHGIPGNACISYAQEPVHLVLLRMFLAQREYDSALALSERLLQPAEATGRIGRAIEILVLRAIAFQGNRDLVQALSALERAVALAQPERYVRVFLDEGEPVRRLLYQAQAHHQGTAYLKELLSALPSLSDTAVPTSQPLVEPLSVRELEVLRLIAAGHSNEEISAKLIISIKTTKRHLSNIYGKLGAKSRTQAVALARELKLIE